jgi:ABC-2 type transport system ATP-binding protein
MGNVLDCVGLVKRFDELTAVDDLSFHIGAGETYGLLGPNGAGKTTAISMVVGILRPDDGSITVGGQPMRVEEIEVKSRVGYVPQDVALYPDLTGRENLRFFANLYGLSRSLTARRSAEVLEIIGLSERADDLVKTFSGGMKRRLNIGVGLLHRPELLILDEPTVGVDPQSRNAILESVRALSQEGMAVLYTTHYMEEAEHLCDRVGILDLGRMIGEGTPRELTTMIGQTDHVRLTAEGDLAAAAARLDDLDSVQRVVSRPDGLEVFDTDARTSLTEILRRVASDGVIVHSVTVEEPNLESVFLHLTGRSLRD